MRDGRHCAMKKARRKRIAAYDELEGTIKTGISVIR